MQVLEAPLEKLRALGLASAFADIPLPQQLQQMFEEAGTQDELREALLQEWGKDCLLRQVNFPGSHEFSRSPLSLDSVLALPNYEFRLAWVERERIRALNKMRYSEVEAPPDLPEWIGFTADDLGEEDRQRLQLLGGAVVQTVSTGSPANESGLLPGDVIWKARRFELEEASGADRPTSEVTIECARELSWMFKEADRIIGRVILHVARGEQSLELTIVLKGEPPEVKRAREIEERLRDESLDRSPGRND